MFMIIATVAWGLSFLIDIFLLGARGPSLELFELTLAHGVLFAMCLRDVLRINRS